MSALSKSSRGGNGDVWAWPAMHHGRDVAVKFVRIGGDRLARFRSEVEVQRGLSDLPGVLPVLAADPDCGAPWLAMPIATELSVDLAGKSLDEVVARVSELAETLAVLHDRLVCHRDIKPKNLYVHEGRACFGDFGLADFPGKDDMTKDGRWLGPVYFMAPEMIDSPATLSSPAADVYSLAKTLWVLAAGVDYPPPGHHPLDTAGMCLRTRLTDERVLPLDALIDRSTAHDPGDRPSARAFADELQRWLAPRSVTAGTSLDLSSFADAVHTAGALADKAADRVARAKSRLPGVFARLSSEMDYVCAALDEAGIEYTRGGGPSSWSSQTAQHLDIDSRSLGGLVGQGHGSIGIGYGVPAMQVAYGVAVDDQERFAVAAGVVVVLPPPAGSSLPFIEAVAKTVRHHLPPDSLELEQACADVARDVGPRVSEGLAQVRAALS